MNDYIDLYELGGELYVLAHDDEGVRLPEMILASDSSDDLPVLDGGVA